MNVLSFWALWFSMMVFINIIKSSIADLSFLPAVCIFDILLLFFSFCVFLTSSSTFDIMFTRNILLWLSLMLALLPPLYILLTVVCLHFVSVSCSLSILLNIILRFLTISYPPSFNHSALHPNLSLALLFFSLAIAFLTISWVIISIWFVFLATLYLLLFQLSFHLHYLFLWLLVVFYNILYIPLVYLTYFPI